MINRFGITEFPKIVVLTNPYTYETDAFKEEIKIDRITKFLNGYSYK